MTALPLLALCVLAASYAVGSIPWAYVIVLLVTGEDITAHGSGNVGAMNVRRTTGSWAWFALAVVADASKGLIPTLVTKTTLTDLSLLEPTSAAGAGTLPVQAAVLGSVLGHNYSLWLGFKDQRLRRTGKGLATGAGALLAYDARYFAVVLVVGLAVLAMTRYMLAGQVAAAIALPVSAVMLGSSDVGFTAILAGLVYLAHHRRFKGLLAGKEPQMYVDDAQGPRG